MQLLQVNLLLANPYANIEGQRIVKRKSFG